MTKNYSMWRPHPWHGLEIGPNPPEVVHAFIEITPFDLIKLAQVEHFRDVPCRP